jgi:hypothetical protein
VHSGFEATAVVDSVKKPWKLAKLAMSGIRTEGPMTKDIPLDRQRPAEYVFSQHVAEKLAELRAKKTGAKTGATGAAERSMVDAAE